MQPRKISHEFSKPRDKSVSGSLFGIKFLKWHIENIYKVEYEKIRVFDPALCCSTGVLWNRSRSGIEVDFATDVDWLKKQGAEM